MSALDKLYLRCARTILLVFFVFFAGGFSACSNQTPDRKIKLHFLDDVSESGVTDELTVSPDSELGRELDGGDDFVLLIPSFNSQNQTHDRAFLSDAEYFTSFLFSENRGIKAVLLSELQGLDEYELDNDTESLSFILDRDLADYYLQVETSESTTEFRLEYSLIDAKSQATVSGLTITKDSKNDVADAVNEFVGLVYKSLFNSATDSYWGVNITYKAMKEFVAGEKAEQENEIKAAMRFYQSSISEDPSFSNAYLRVISLYYRNEKDFGAFDIREYLDGAARFADTMSEKNALMLTAFNNYNFQKLEEALSSFSTLKTNYPDIPEGYIGLAKTYLLQNQPEQALEHTSQNENILQNNIALMQLHSRAYVEVERYDEALDLIHKYQALNPSNLESKIDEANLYIKMSRDESAIRVLNDVLNADSTYYKARMAMSHIYLEQMDFQSATDALRQIDFTSSVINQNDLLELNYKLLLSYVYSGQYYSAVSVCKNLLRLVEDGEYSDIAGAISIYAAYLLNDLKEYEEMIDIITPMIDYSSSDPNLFSLAAIMNQQSEATDYKELYSAFYQRLTSGKMARKGIFESIKSGIESWYGGKHQEALNIFQKIQKDEFNPIIEYFIAKSLAETGKYAEAQKRLDNFYNNMSLGTLETGIVLPKMYFLQADMLEKQGNTVAAKQIYSSLENIWQKSDPGIELKQEIAKKASN